MSEWLSYSLMFMILYGLHTFLSFGSMAAHPDSPTVETVLLPFSWISG